MSAKLYTKFVLWQAIDQFANVSEAFISQATLDAET